jgi:ferredoxin--NADP+ reductase
MALLKEKVTEVKHWSDKTFTFKTTRNPGFRFNNGEFTMMGLQNEDGKKIMRAYSMASPNYEDHIEWLSIKIDDGPLTSKLQNIKVGDTVVMNKKATGTLVIDYLKPGRNLYLVATGTGLAPFLSIIKDIDTYKRFEKVILTHTVQKQDELVYREDLEWFNVQNENITNRNFVYFTTLTKDEWRNQGRITKWIAEDKLWPEVYTDKFDAKHDRMMICGSQGLNADLMKWLETTGAKEGSTSKPAEFVVEKAFVQR